MALPVEMPKMSDTMTEGVLSAWLANEGDAVSSGDVIAQVETDKATMDLEVYDDGVLLKKMIEEGAAVPIGSLIAVLGKKGEDISGILAKYAKDGGGQAADVSEPEPPATVEEADRVEGEALPTNRTEKGEPPTAPAAVPTGDGAASKAPVPAASAPASSEGGRLKASPLARRLASEHGVELGAIKGSGPEGRIVRRDVEAAAQSAQPQPAAQPQTKEQPQAVPQSAPAVATADYTAQPISQMRKAISRRLAQSKFTAPHFYLEVDVDMENAATFRQEMNALAEKAGKAKVSYNDLVTKACAVALKNHPYVNASYMEKEGELRFHTKAHVAVAVAIDEGLITPVVRDADAKGLAQIAAETRDLATRARDRKLSPEEYEGSTFTTSNLGMFGIEAFTAIINPPNACILAIGAIRDVPVVKNGAVVPGKKMKITLSCDHRVVDGASGSAFLTEVQGYLENPITMLL